MLSAGVVFSSQPERLPRVGAHDARDGFDFIILKEDGIIRYHTAFGVVIATGSVLTCVR